MQRLSQHFQNASARSLAVATAAVILLMSPAMSAQPPLSHSVQAQREAMRKLEFLVGNWSGPVTIVRGPGEPVRLAQIENVQFRLDGLVLLIEGKSTGVDDKAQFEALATIAYDEDDGKYHIRAYNDGHYLDTEFTALADGFTWGFQGGPAHIVNTMHLTPQGQWQETTDVTMGNSPPRRSVDMLLDREK